jgi:hypothetical protein
VPCSGLISSPHHTSPANWGSPTLMTTRIVRSMNDE